MNTIPVLKRSIPFFAGWFFLGFVAVGTLDKNGWLGFVPFGR